MEINENQLKMLQLHFNQPKDKILKCLHRVMATKLQQ
jgi:hypothetical protein